MTGSSSTAAEILEHTPFKYPCNIYKENTIPILKDYNVSDQCKEIGKQLLNMTKNPLSQHVDVLIPKFNRDTYSKSHMEHFKSFFGTKYIPEQQQQQQQEAHTMQKSNSAHTFTPRSPTESRNVFQFECSATKPIIEFISTEETYVDMLDDFVTKIMRPIKDSITDPNKTPILDQYSFNRIFINLEDILEVNRSFLASLKEYENSTTTESFGQILLNHIEAFDCYKIYLLGKPNSLSCHSQNLKQNKAYAKFLLNKSLQKNFGMSDVLISPVQRMGRYDLMIKNIISALNTGDSDIPNLNEAYSKVGSINDMRYGSDSSLLNLYYLIREAPASLIQTRKLLGYFDASELSLVTGKTHRPVTILVFTDKIMVVKRKNYNLQSKDYLENIEERVKVGSSNTILQKAKEVYNGLPLEFKGWADIHTVEVFNGLKDRPDTFFLRTRLPELDPNATEKECENYFRRSDRLYSIIPSTGRTANYMEKKQEFIALCQKQYALSKVKETTELYHEDKFKLPAYTNIYDEESYSQAEHKNHILIVYVEDNCAAKKINLAPLLTDDVWIVMLLTHHESGGYKPTIRARASLIPIRDISREMEYESITNAQRKEPNAPLDFIDTLWNNLFFYERRLRATDAFSSINDDLLRERARSRSRSKSLTRVASNMSIGKLFARSRSTSPSRHSSSNERTDDDDEQVTTPASCVPDPIFKVATVNKHTGGEFRTQYSPPPSLSHKSHSGPAVTTASINDFYASHHTAADKGYKPSKINTQPHYRYNAESRNNYAAAPSEIFIRDDHTFIDSFNEVPKQEDVLYKGTNYYQDNNLYNSRPSYHSSTSHRHGSISSSAGTLDAMLFQSSPELMSRPSSGGSSGNSHSSVSSETDRTLSRGFTMSDSISSNTSSIRSYFDEINYFASPTSSTTRGSISDRYRSNNNTSSYDERIMNVIDGSRRSNASSTSSRRAPLHPAFYSNPHVSQQQQQQQQAPPPMAHRSHTMPDMMSANINRLKDDVNGLIDELIQSQQQLRSQQDMGRYYNSTYEGVQGLRTHIVSKIDNLMENLHHSNPTQSHHHHHQFR